MSGYSNWSGSTPWLWDDLRFAASVFNPIGAASDPDVENSSGLLLFDATSTEYYYVLAQMPHTWKVGSAIEPHVHWSPTTTDTGNVLWRLDYQVRNPVGDTAFDFTSGWSTLDVLAAAGGTMAPRVSSFGSVNMTGFGISSLIVFRINRIGGDASDTYAADARLYEFDLHYQQAQEGSRGQTTV